MKIWITYLIAVLMGAAASFLFRGDAVMAAVLEQICYYVTQTGVLIAFIFFALSALSATAALRRDSMFAPVLGKSILWSLLSSILAILAAFLILAIFPAAFTAPSGDPIGLTENLVYINQASASNLAGTFFNPILAVANQGTSFLPLIALVIFLGYFLKPNSMVIRPAYVVANSFSEASYRMAIAYSRIVAFGVFFYAALRFIALPMDETVVAALPWIGMVAILAGLVILVVYPITFWIFTGFKKNPYKALLRSAAPALMALFSGNFLVSATVAEVAERRSMGVQKKVASLTTPVLYLIGRSGTAALSFFTIISLVRTLGVNLSLTQMLLIAALSVSFSLLSTFHLGHETAFIVFAVASFLGLGITGYETAILALLPVLAGVSTLLDVLSATLGTAAIGNDMIITPLPRDVI